MGEWIKQYPDTVKAIHEEGHELGNHSENHFHMTQLDKEEITQEIDLVTQQVKTLVNVQMNLFRPPYGNYNNEVLSIAENLGYQTIQWNIDAADWKGKGFDTVIDHVVNSPRLNNGAIILLHTGTQDGLNALEAILQGVHEKGYQLVPLGELLYKKDFYVEAGVQRVID